MKDLFENYRNRLLVIAFITIICLLIPSQFQKGGTDNSTKYLFFSIIFGCALFYMLFSNATILEKILASSIAASIAVIISLIFTGQLLEIIYGNDYESSLNPTIANSIFYFSANFISIGLLHLLLKYKGEIQTTANTR